MICLSFDYVFPTVFLAMCENILAKFLDMSKKCRGHVPEMSKTLPTKDMQKHIHVRHVQEISENKSGTFQEHVHESSKTHPIEFG